MGGMAAFVSQLVIDAAEPATLARWWIQVLDWPISYEDETGDEVEITPPVGGTPWLFVRVPDAKSTKNRLHVDVRPPDGSSQAAELERLLALGATRVDVGQGPDVTWHVLADPEGNEFCLLRSTPAQLAAARAAAGT